MPDLIDCDIWLANTGLMVCVRLGLMHDVDPHHSRNHKSEALPQPTRQRHNTLLTNNPPIPILPVSYNHRTHPRLKQHTFNRRKSPANMSWSGIVPLDPSLTEGTNGVVGFKKKVDRGVTQVMMKTGKGIKPTLRIPHLTVEPQDKSKRQTTATSKPNSAVTEPWSPLRTNYKRRRRVI